MTRAGIPGHSRGSPATCEGRMGGMGGDPLLPLAARSRSKVLKPQRAERRGDSHDRTLAGRARLRSWVVLISLVAPPIGASAKARTFRVPVGSESVRVIVPKTFEPVLPGSVYPNRRMPAASRPLPVAILAPEAAPALEFLLERSFLVAERRSAPIEDLLAALASRPEADASRAAVFAFREAPARPAAIRATAIFDPDPERAGPAGSGPVALFLRAPGRAPSSELSNAFAARFGPSIVEKWYRSETGFPEQAYRDAAEWAAAALSR